MKEYYSIGEMAKLNYISTHTLRYYDKIGLLKPSYVDDDTGYRYYTYKDFLFLDTIQYLKLFNMSLKEIKEQFENRTAESMTAAYRKQLPVIRKKIEELHGVEKRISFHIKNLEERSECYGCRTFDVRHMPERQVLLIDEPVSSDYEYEVAIRKLSHFMYRDDISSMGEFIGIKDRNDILTGEYGITKHIGSMLTGEITGHACKVIKAGRYLRLCHVGSTEKMRNTYTKMKRYIKENGLEIGGDVLEIYKVDLIDTQDPDSYMTVVEIPLK